MSKYTTEVRYICETASGYDESQGYKKISDIIAAAIPNVFDFDFPMFDEKYRNVLCTKILRHYYTREICEETVGLWKLRLETRLNEIMPYYNKLYESETLKFNPLYDMETTTKNDANKNENVNRNGTSDGNVKNTGTTTDDGTRRDLYSDTPQGSLENVENETYLTNARKVLDETTQNRTDNADSHTIYDESTTLNNTEQYVQTVVGKSGGTSYSKLLREFRDTFLNIDVRIINDLEDLFFGLW